MERSWRHRPRHSISANATLPIRTLNSPLRACKHKIGLRLFGILGEAGCRVAEADFDVETVS